MQTLSPDDIRAETVQAWIIGDSLIRVMCQLSNSSMSLVQARIYEMAIRRPDQSRLIFHYDDLMPSFWSDNGPFWLALESGDQVHSSRGDVLDVTGGTDGDISLRRLWGLGDELVLAVGKGGAYRFDGRAWHSEKLPTPHILLDVHGSAPDRIFAVGNRGVLVEFDGRRWTNRDTGIHNRLHAVHAGDDGAVYAGGDEGTCFRLSGEERVDYDIGDATIQTICQFQGKRYWGDDSFGIYVQDRDSLASFREIEFAYYMSSSNKYMTVTSGNKLFLFDGAEWQSYVYRYRDGDWGFYFD